MGSVVTPLRSLAPLVCGVLICAVVPPAIAAAPPCDRACLESVVDRTLASFVAHDPTAAPLAPDLRATENGTAVPVGDGLWKRVAGLTDYRIVAADPLAGQVAYIGTVTQTDGKPLMLALRLKVANGRVTELEAVTNAPFEFPSSPLVATPRPTLSRVVPPRERLTREQMIAVAERNFDNIVAADGSHFAADCQRIENRQAMSGNAKLDYPIATLPGRAKPNFAAMGCREQVESHLFDTLDSVGSRRYLVIDEERQLVFGVFMLNWYRDTQCNDVRDYGRVCRPEGQKPTGLRTAEVLRVEGGKVHDVEVVFAFAPYEAPSGWEPPGIAARAQERALSFTAGQAAAGLAAYRTNCVVCHGPELNGPLGKPLKGPEFMKKYGGRSPAVLFETLRTTMPTGRPGSLDAPTYAALTAYLLSQNSIVAGDQPLPTDVRELAGMQVPTSGFSLIGYSPYAPLTTVTLPDPLTAFTPVTNADLVAPPAKDWLTWRGGWDAHGASPLAQITPSNVAGLRVAWSWTLPPGSAQAVPLVRDGTLFVEGFGDVVQAIDAKTGDLLWQYAHGLEQGAAPSQKRGIALWGERLFVATSDVHVVALDVHTGKVAWDTRVGDFTVREGLTGGPLVADGTVLVGTAGTGVGAKPGGPQLIGLDATTGRERWRIGTIAKPGEAGGDSWNGVPFPERSGASVWTPATYDPVTKLAYFGTGNTYDTAPLLKPAQKGMTRDALYTNATIAVEPATGRIAWYRQHFPNDQWDLDWAFERQLVDLDVRGATRRVVVTAGKIGIVDALDARTGEFLFSIDLGLQNIVKAIDPLTGEKHVDTSLYPGDGKVKMTCPHAVGAKSYLPSAWNGQSRVLFMPLNETCMDVFPVPGGGPGTLNTGVNLGIRPRPASDGNIGRLQALDLVSRKPVWTARSRAPVTSGVLSTGGGLVFAATLDRVFRAYDAASGKVLWQARLNDVSGSSPITYSVEGRQYVAITVGPGVHASSFAALVPEIKPPANRGSAVWVFALP